MRRGVNYVACAYSGLEMERIAKMKQLIDKTRPGKHTSCRASRAECYFGTVTVVTDGDAAPVKVSAPAPPAPASTLPMTVDPSFTVTVLPARMFPFQLVPDPMVTSRPATNQTFLAWAPLTRMIRLLSSRVPESMRSESTLKMKTAFASFWASRVAAPPAAIPRFAL